MCNFKGGRYNLYFEALKGLLLKNAPYFFLIFAENFTLLSLNIIKLVPFGASYSKYKCPLSPSDKGVAYSKVLQLHAWILSSNWWITWKWTYKYQFILSLIQMLVIQSGNHLTLNTGIYRNLSDPLKKSEMWIFIGIIIWIQSKNYTNYTNEYKSD